MPLKFNSSIPYYYQIKENILQKIEQGIYSVGKQLPPELELVKEYGVSRPTIRQAISELVQEGILVRYRGKGTFISQPLIPDNAQVFTSFERSEQDNVDPWTKIIDFKQINATVKVAEELNINIGDSVYEIVILRLNQKEKLAVRTMQIPVNLAQHLDGKDISLDILSNFLHKETDLAGALQTFQSVTANKEESLLFEVKQGTPLMLWQGIIYTVQNKPVIRVKTLFRGDRFKFYITQGKVEFDKSTLISIALDSIATF